MARSRKLKKALKALGAGIAIAGLGRAFANRNARASTDADAIKAMTSDAAYSGSKKMPVKKAEPVVVDTPVSVPIGKMRGAGSDADAIANQNIRATYAQKMRNAVTGVDGSPMILNPINNRVMVGRGEFKKGGRVGCGIAKKGFGKAMKKGKK